VVAMADPVRDGLVASLARPSGNISGVDELHSCVKAPSPVQVRCSPVSGARAKPR
jgi:hypothetical protein